MPERCELIITFAAAEMDAVARAACLTTHVLQAPLNGPFRLQGTLVLNVLADDIEELIKLVSIKLNTWVISFLYYRLVSKDIEL